MIDKLNIEAYEFVKLISIRPKQAPNQGEGLKGSAKERGVNDFSDRIDGKGVTRIMNDAEKIVAIFLITDNESYGIDEEEYPLYEAFIDRIYLLNEFKNTVSKSFIEHKAFDWIIDIYQNKQSNGNLIDHLLLEASKVIKEHEFYFPILNLDIESPFKLGNVEFTFFKEDYLNELYQHYQTIPTPIGENDFKEIFRKDYQGKPLVKIIIKAERQKAEELAIDYAETAVDVLKIFSSTLLIPEQRMMFDLNHRLNYPEKSKFLSKDPIEKHGYAINIRWNNPLFELTNKHMDFALKAGMQTFSDFITLKKRDDFYNLLIQAIHFTAS